MDLRALPTPPRLHTAAPAEWFRVHDAIYSPLSFNPSPASNARFSPFERSPGSIVASLYAGSSIKAALMETVFHEAPIPSAKAILTERAIQARRWTITSIEATQPLSLVDLTSPGLRRIGLSRGDLIDTNARSLRGRSPRSETCDDRGQFGSADKPRVGPLGAGGDAKMDRLLARCSRGASAAQAPNYPFTQKFAKNLYTQFPTAQGIRWVSRLYDEGVCIVLWDDRIPSGILVQSSIPVSVFTEPTMSQILDLVDQLDMRYLP